MAPLRNIYLAPLRNIYLAPLRNIYLAHLRNIYLAPLRNIYLAPLRNIYLAPLRNIFWHLSEMFIWHLSERENRGGDIREGLDQIEFLLGINLQICHRFCICHPDFLSKSPRSSLINLCHKYSFISKIWIIVFGDNYGVDLLKTFPQILQ